MIKLSLYSENTIERKARKRKYAELSDGDSDDFSKEDVQALAEDWESSTAEVNLEPDRYTALAIQCMVRLPSFKELHLTRTEH